MVGLACPPGVAPVHVIAHGDRGTLVSVHSPGHLLSALRAVIRDEVELVTLFKNVASGSLPGGDVWNFVIYTDGTGNISAANTAWVNALTLWFNDDTPAGSAFKTFCPNTATLDTGATAQIDPLTGKQLQRITTSIALTGATSFTPMPRNTCPVVMLFSGEGTRATRGWIHLPPVDAGTIAAGRISSIAQNDFATGAQKMLNSLASAGFIGSLYGRKSTTITHIFRISVSDIYGHQQSRISSLVPVRVVKAITLP